MKFDDVLIKARYYCAMQERSIFELKRKLFAWKVSEGDMDAVIDHLVEKDFLSEERFSRLFAVSKVNQNKWGKIKIRVELQKHGISKEVIEDAISGLDQNTIDENIAYLANKKFAELERKGADNKLAKLHMNLASKGYENELIIEYLNKLKYDNK